MTPCEHPWQERVLRADGQVTCRECQRTVRITTAQPLTRVPVVVSVRRISAQLLFDERFARMADRRGGPNACWPWLGKGTNGGYGRVRFEGRLRYAHRVAFWLEYGSWPEAVCHRCDNPPCVNPRHLREGTLSDNTAEMWAKGRQNVLTKVPPDAVPVIRARLASGEKPPDIAADYGVSKRTIYRYADPTYKRFARGKVAA